MFTGSHLLVEYISVSQGGTFLQRHGRQLLLSASDLVAFHECEHASALDRAALEDTLLRAQRIKPDETGQLYIDKGHEFEAEYLACLKHEHVGVVEIPSRSRRAAEPASQGDPAQRAAEHDSQGGLTERAAEHDSQGDLAQRAAATLEAMRSGASVIYQATFVDDGLLGHADFLRRVERPSALGAWSYEVVDTKFARSAKAAYVLQLAFYGELLGKAQQLEPRAMHVVLGNHQQVSFACAEYSRYFRGLLARFRSSLSRDRPDITYPTPCDRCEICHWRERCEHQREADDSLYLVANIRSSQAGSLGREIPPSTTLASGTRALIPS